MEQLMESLLDEGSVEELALDEKSIEKLAQKFNEMYNKKEALKYQVILYDRVGMISKALSVMRNLIDVMERNDNVDNRNELIFVLRNYSDKCFEIGEYSNAIIGYQKLIHLFSIKFESINHVPQGDLTELNTLYHLKMTCHGKLGQSVESSACIQMMEKIQLIFHSNHVRQVNTSSSVSIIQKERNVQKAYAKLKSSCLQKHHK